MFTRRLFVNARPLNSSIPASRAFATAPAHQYASRRTPALGDITPNGAPAFEARQEEFREKQAAAQKQRELQEEAQTSSSQDPEASKRKGPLSSLIYGTKEGQQLDKDIETSFSQVLARGKYVHSIVFHDVKPDKVDEYVDLVGNWYPRMAGMPENKVHLVGSWRTEVGDCNTFVHIWEYQRYQGYHASLNSISRHPEYLAFDKKLK